MKRIIFYFISAMTFILAGCTESFDDSKLWDAINDHENRITKLEELCKQLNTNISALQTIVSALEQNDYITNVSPVQKEGKVVGYTITFAKSGTITIYNGEDGKDGEDGNDGSTPQIGVAKDTDDIYYWTINGEWLLDSEGNKIKAVGQDGTNGTNGADGEDGKDGTDGTDGKDGITPRLKIENDYWYISYDDGKSWEQLGKAKGEDGADGSDGADGNDGTDGDSFFKSVTQDEEHVYFELADGTIIAVQYSMPAYAINLSETSLDFDKTAGETTIDILTQAQWEITIPEEAQSWVTINPMQGNGDATITISVTDNLEYVSRSTIIVCSSIHPEYGVWDSKRFSISQKTNKIAIYSDNFDKITAERDEISWPFLSADYTNPKGSAAANVTYKVDGKVTVRNSGKLSNDTDYSSYKGSGVNKVFFGATPTSLVVENIALPADQQNYVLSFGANYYDMNKTDNTFNKAEFVVSVSKDGVAWTEIEYSFEEGLDLNGTWNEATASLKLAEVPEALYIKFEAKISSIISIDDIKLSTGGAGEQEVVFAEAPVIEDIEGTVTEVLEAEQGANVKAIDATVVAVSSRAYLLTDGTSYILAYMSEGAPEIAVGDKVTVEGEMSEYNGVPQIANPVATKTGAVENFAQPEATVIDGAALDAYKDNFAIKYVKIADANLVKSGNYWTFTVEGATTTGSLSYPTAEMCPDTNNGKEVTVYGYVIYMSGASSQYINVIATSVEVTGEGEKPAEPSEELGDDERYLSDEGLMITEDGDVKAYAQAVTIEGKKYPALKLGTSSKVGSWTTAKVGVEGDYTLSFYAFGWSGKEAEVTVTVDDETVLTVQPIANANISGTATNFPVTVDQEKNFYSVELKGLTAESTITFATTEGKYRAVLFGIQLNQPETSEPVDMEPEVRAEGYQGAKISWEAVEVN